MAIRNWHPGKVILVWVAALSSFFFFDGLPGLGPEIGWSLALLVALGTTWICFSGREK